MTTSENAVWGALLPAGGNLSLFGDKKLIDLRIPTGKSALVGAVYIASRSFEQLTDAFVLGFFPFYMLAVLAAFRLPRTEPELPRPFRVPLYPLVPVIFLIGAGCLMVGALLDADRTALFALGIMLAGFPASRSSGLSGSPRPAPTWRGRSW